MSRILDVVDMQGDFMLKSGILSVPGADLLIARTNDFFKALPAEAFDAALFKYDTHFADEYRRSPEAAWFPLHCEYGTPGWQLVAEPTLLTTATFYMTKNTFDMWGVNPLTEDQIIIFKNDDEKKAYANLRHVTPDPRGLKPGLLRDQFIASLKADGKPLQVTLIGVASNFCDDDAILGYLKEGADVTVLEDLVAGLPTDAPGRAPSGDIRDVILLPKYEDYMKAGKLHLSTSTEFLRSLKP